MTTTVEKLDLLRKRVDSWAKAMLEIQDELKKLEKEHNTKQPDPKPLECWVDWHKGEPRAAFTQPMLDSIRMREVTPQDERDREDPAVSR